MSDLQYWIALNLVPDIGPVLSGNLLSTLGSPEDIFRASFKELKNVNGIGESRAGKIAGFDRWDRVRKEIDTAQENNIRIIACNDPAYPEGLKRIHGTPPVIYVRGNLADMDKYAVGMVGSRNATAYGTQAAEKISRKLAASGLTIVSGMARGIDTVSHRGALDAGGRTIAVLGSGLDVPYPFSNRELMENIEYSGAVISEFPLGTQPIKENFPRRNRIISALSLGVIVVEATLDSGSLITVRYALEHGKEVFAVPGSINSVNSRGTNDLIKKGASLIESADEVIDELRPQINGILREEKVNTESQMDSMSEDEKKIYGSLSNGPKHIDSIIREINLTTGSALSTLLNLELKGIVRQAEGKHFTLN
jgi:DNA processing protein